MNSDAGALRDSVMKSSTAEWEQDIELGVGPITFYLARAALAVAELDPDARTALNAVRAVEVGVYRPRGGLKQLHSAAVLRSADNAMARRGWERIVGVIRQRELVAIYAPRQVRSARDMKVCLVALNGEELVVASARSNLEPLAAMAFRRTGWRPPGLSP
jgi:hypothetical protein